MQLNNKLQQYIEKNIFPSYKKNDLGHNLDHIKYVIDRSLKFASEVDSINYDMVYTIAAYHDIGHYIDAKNHEKVSAEMLLADENLKKYFTDNEIKTMAEAVYDHRASLEGEPRSIYGKIVSSADRNTLVDVPLKRTYAYRVEHNPNDTLDEIIEESRQHIISKFGKKGYATEKMYFEDLDYKKFLEDISNLAENKEEFRKRFIEVNGLNNKLKLTFDEIKRHNPNMSLDEVLYAVYDKVKDEYNKPFDVLRNMILEANGIDKFEYYTKNVRQDLKDYIAEHIFPEYDKNYGGHGWEHIQDVINRSFELMETFNLGINPNMVYVIAVYHDIGYRQDPDNHEQVSSEMFLQDKNIQQFFNEEEIKVISEAIVDHRASLEYEARSIYGKLVSSADRAIDVDSMLKRSIAFQSEKHKAENPSAQDIIEYSYKKLSSKYGNGGYAKMYFPDDKYQEYLDKMNKLFSDKSEFVKAEMDIISRSPELLQKLYVNSE